MIFAPMLLSVIHQNLLGGKEAAPMNLNAVFDALAELAALAVKADGGATASTEAAE